MTDAAEAMEEELDDPPTQEQVHKYDIKDEQQKQLIGAYLVRQPRKSSKSEHANKKRRESAELSAGT